MENNNAPATVGPATEPERFVLRTTLTSPFGRKVRMAAVVLGLSDRVTVMAANVADEHDTLRRQNPLGKMPCLVRGDGSSIYDSTVILEFLQHVAGNERLLPVRGPARFPLQTLARLADGIIDAGALTIYEANWHGAEHVSEPWRAYQKGKISRALAAFEASPPDPRRTDAVAIGLSCALEFLDRRKPLEWRADCPRLTAWLSDFVRHEPAFERVHEHGADYNP
jgi:glutathione S-transferase